MKPHQERVVVELEELSTKLQKLNEFIENNSNFAAIDSDEQSRLKRQSEIMQDYVNILQERINAFT